MKSAFLSICILIIALSSLYGQKKFHQLQDKTIQIEENKIPFKAYNGITTFEYDLWKKGLPKRKKNAVAKGTIAGFVAGALFGHYLSLLSKGGCELVPAIATPIVGESEPCIVSPKGAIIGGGLGVLIGLAVGQEKAKRIN